MSRLYLVIKIATVVGLLNLCSGSAFAAIDVSHAWLRAPIPGQSMTAAYFRLHNTGDTHRKLVGVEAEFAERAEMHTQILSDGMMRMRALDSVDLAAGDVVEFVSGGHHIMIFGLPSSRSKDKPWRLILLFDNGERFSVDLQWRSLADSHQDSHSHHH